MAEKRSIYILNTLLPVDSSSTSITYNLVMSLINRRNFLVKNSHKQFFIKRMFVLKESKYRRNAWVFLSEHSRKSGIYFVFCVTEHLRRMVCSVLEINVCWQDLQEIIIYKTINKNFTAINKGYFKSDYNPFQKQPPEVFYKKAVLKSSAIFSGKHLCWSLFLIKLKVFRSATLLKRDSNTGNFLWILQNF